MDKSKFYAWLERQPRWHKDVEIAGGGLANHDGSPVGRARVWVNTKTDDNEAALCAYLEAERMAAKYTATAVDEAKRDPDFIEDMKTVHALWRALRDPDEPERPLFPTPESMKDRLNSHQIGYLLNVYNACKLEAANLAPKYDRAQVEALRDGIIVAWESRLPESSLAPLPREHLVALAVTAMRAWHDEREALIARIAELERAELEAAQEKQHAGAGVDPGGSDGAAG